MFLRRTALAAALIVVACDARLPFDPESPPEVPPEVAAAWSGEGDRLGAAVGQSANEEPLRQTIRVLSDPIPTDPFAYAARVKDMRSTFSSYQWKDGDAIDPADVDAIDLVIWSMERQLTAPQTAVSYFDGRQ